MTKKKDGGIVSVIEQWRAARRAGLFDIRIAGALAMEGSLEAKVIEGHRDARPLRAPIGVGGIPSEETFGTPSIHVGPPPITGVLDATIGAITLEGTATVTLRTAPEVLIKAGIILFGDRAKEGTLIEGVAIPWFEIIDEIDRDPDFLHKIPSRKMEELVAGAYERAGWDEVILTPRSGDKGRDVIATRRGIGGVRIFDEVKAYRPDRPVPEKDVRALLGVMAIHPNVSKGVITTTSRFAPGVAKNKDLMALIPNRLELKNGSKLIEWLMDLRRSTAGKKPRER